MTDRETYLRQFEEKRRRIQKMRATGMSYSEIARALKVSRQAVRQIAEKLRAAGK